MLLQTSPLCGEFTGDRWICSYTWNSLVVSSILFFHILDWASVMSFISDSSFICPILLAGRIVFFSLLGTLEVYYPLRIGGSLLVFLLVGIWRFLLLQWIYSVVFHYNDVIMGATASQITSIAIVYSTVYSSADQRKHQSSASLAFVRGIHWWPVNSPHKWPVYNADNVSIWWRHHVLFFFV